MTTWTLDLSSDIGGPQGVCRRAPSDLAGYPDAVSVCEEPPPLTMPYLQAVTHASVMRFGWATLTEKSAEFVTYDIPSLPDHWSPQLIPCWFLNPVMNVMTLVCLFPMGDLPNAPGFKMTGVGA